jgi:cell division protein FtsW (lipid II flippase)
MANSDDMAASTGTLHPLWAVGAALAALICGYLGMGLPQHFYQPLFALIVLVLAYRHGHVVLPVDGWRWPIALLFFLLLCMLFKLLIGGGTTHPFSWLKIPALELTPASEDSSWYQRVLPDVNVTLKGVANLSDWAVDITKIQTLFLIATLLAAIARFQPFASLTALALLVVSIPTLASFNWDWVLLFLILGGTAFYLRSPSGMHPTINRPKSKAP